MLSAPTVSSDAISSPTNSPIEALDVLIIGAGFSGICAGIKLLEQGISDFKIVEKADKVGGTWHYNTYPGIACDVASHLYCYSFEPNPNWSKVFSPGAEIRNYIEHCANKYGVSSHINHGMEFKSAQLNANTMLWEVEFTDGSQVHAHHIISGSGGLHIPSYPNIPGIDYFKGAAMHSATWDHTVDFTGKRVAVIGTAASAVQIIPEIAKLASHVDVYQRSPNYIMPRNNRDYSDQEKQRFKKWPLLSWLLRLKIFLQGELTLFPLVKTKKDTKYSLRARRLMNLFMSHSVKDESLHDHLTPDYAPGCKRILLSDDFFRTLNRDNVTLLTDGVKSIIETGVTTNKDEQRDVDIIVYATGYDIEKQMVSVPFVNAQGVNLSDIWQTMPEAYEGAMVCHFPNLFMTTGPNTGVGSTSVVYMIEKQVNYIMQCIKKAGRTKLISPKPEVMRAFNEEIQGKLQETVWAGNCTSYYKRDDGKIATLYPYNARTFSKRHKKVKWNEFEIVDK